jgi:hypothetical protein
MWPSVGDVDFCDVTGDLRVIDGEMRGSRALPMLRGVNTVTNCQKAIYS